METNKKPVAMRLSEETRKGIKTLAESIGVSATDIMEMAVREMLARHLETKQINLDQAPRVFISWNSALSDVQNRLTQIEGHLSKMSKDAFEAPDESSMRILLECDVEGEALNSFKTALLTPVKLCVKKKD